MGLYVFYAAYRSGYGCDIIADTLADAAGMAHRARQDSDTLVFVVYVREA